MNHVNRLSPLGAAVLAAALHFLAFGSAAAQNTDGFYLSKNIGLTSAFGAHVTAFGAHHPTRCDRLLYANPADAPSDAECTASLTSSSQGAYAFDRDTGRAQSIAVGYAAGSLRFEAELLLRQQLGEAVPFTAGDQALVTKDTEWSALAEPNGDIYDFSSTQLFGNAYYAFGRNSSWTPYLGAGAGLARVNFGFYAAFHRKSIDEGYLEVFGGSKSNPDAAPTWQRAAAGTLSMLDEPVDGWAFGYQLLLGIDRSLGARSRTVGLKARWTSLATLSASPPWTMIRSHEPLHADGRTPFAWDFDFADLGYLGAALEMRLIL